MGMTRGFPQRAISPIIGGNNVLDGNVGTGLQVCPIIADTIVVGLVSTPTQGQPRYRVWR